MANAGASGLHSLATIIKRLEAATSRIEDLAASNLGTGNAPPPSGAATGPSATSYGATPPPPAATTESAQQVSQQTPQSIKNFDEEIIEKKIKPFVQLSKELGSASVAEIADLVQKEYESLRSYLLTAASCQKPAQSSVLEPMLKALEEAIVAIPRAKEAHRKDRDWSGHLTVVSEGAAVIGWVARDTPMAHITEVKEQTEFWANRVIKEFKEKDKKHVEWVRAFMSTFDALKAYVKEFHTAGLTWNPRGIPFDRYSAPSSSGTGAPAPPPPPPPPPPPGAAPAAGKAPAAGGGGGAAAVFAELNKGEAITKSLRKVDKSEMTHKNPALRAGSTVPASVSPSNSISGGKKPLKPTKPVALAGKKPPKFVLEGNKWTIEWQEGETLTVEDTAISHSINIFNCKNTVVVIKGKVNAVTLHNSTKTSILIDSVVSSISVTASPSFALQITGAAPMIQLDSTDSGQIYLSKASLNAEITTAKCSSINISLPVEGEEEGVFEEQPIPEMLKTIIKDGKLITTVVEHVG
ncbi:adenylyl cyclase-associated protein [Coprinopsis sp. MPI-PUGE-AT-0042]|nr:adenylyl cyclase-associated protein [Coprinopsis sp. MPI-PUGE-AT-0042]